MKHRYKLKNWATHGGHKAMFTVITNSKYQARLRFHKQGYPYIKMSDLKRVRG